MDLDLGDPKNDWDLAGALAATLTGVTVEEVRRVLGVVPGENDGPSWWYLLEMTANDIAVLNAWCDYTGWGCQDGGTLSRYFSIPLALDDLPDEENGRPIRAAIEAQLEAGSPEMTPDQAKELNLPEEYRRF